MEEEYINFGDEQILKSDFLKALNDAKSYSSTQPWSAARRGAFDAVAELAANRGILSTRKYINPETGESMYYATFGGTPFDINTYDKNTRRGWQDYVNFVGKVAESLPTKKSIDEKKKKEEEERLAKLPTFDNEAFKNLLIKDITTGTFGGTKFDINEWNKLDDVRDEKGAVGTSERKRILAQHLRNIDRDFKAEDYNWKDSPFKDADDFKSRIATAVEALESPETNDDVPALRNLGLNYEKMFNNRTGEIYGQDEAGNPITYGAYYRGLQEAKNAKAKQAIAEKQAKIRAYNANLIGGLTFHGKGLTGSSLSPENSNLKYLNQLAAKDSWSGDELSQLVGVFKLAQRNNALENLSKEELATFGPKLGSNPNRFKKIRGLNGIYWDSSTNQIAKPYARGQQNSGVNFQNILDQNNPEKLKEKQKEQAAKNMNTPISQMTEWSPEMKKEMEAIGWDIASIIDPEAFSGSAMALYASHLRDEANPNRSTLEKWLDRGTAALGGIQGVGDLLVTGKLGYRLYQLGKSMGSVSKFAGMLGAGFGAIGAYEARDSIMKLSNPSSLTPQDIENISYGFMGLIGLKSFAKARNKQTIGKQANPTVAEHNITVNDKNGTHVIKVDETTAKEINNSYKFGRNNKNKSDAKTFNHEKVKKAVEEYNKNPENTKKIDLESASIQSSSKFGITTEKPVKTKYVRDPNTPEYAPVGTKYWFDPLFHPGYIPQGNNKFSWMLGGWQRKAWENAVPEQSSKGLWQRTKEFLNPEPIPIQSKSKETPKTTETPKLETNTPKVTENKSSLDVELYNKNRKYEDNILNTPNRSGRSKVLQKGDSQSAILADGNNYKFVYSYDGEALVTLNGKPVVNPVKVKSQEEAKEIFSNFVKSINDKLKVNNQSMFVRRFSKKYLDSIRELKRKGFFRKHGGTLTLDETIENFLKNNNI